MDDLLPPDVPELIEYRVTFGTLHASYHPRPGGFQASTSGWLAVLATDEMCARMGTHAALDRMWSMIYAPGDAHYPSEGGRWYPRGEIGRLRILGPEDAVTWQWLRLDDSGAWVPKPVVYAVHDGDFFGDQRWVAVTADGRVIGSHVSSSREWGAHDVSPDRTPALYVEAVGTTDVDYRVIPEGESLPREVIEAVLANPDTGRPVPPSAAPPEAP